VAYFLLSTGGAMVGIVAKDLQRCHSLGVCIFIPFD